MNQEADRTLEGESSAGSAASPLALSVQPFRSVNRYQWYLRVKRLLDVTIAGIALVCLLPVLAVIALAIKLDSPGPVLFNHKRVGARFKHSQGEWSWEVCQFEMHKFRSMFQHADQSLHEAHIKAYVEGRLPQIEGDGAQFKLRQDPRVTRVGRILRRTSLDELPQLINVLRGEMSLVGPRPVPPYEVARYQPWQRERLSALPGITGLWQVAGRGQVGFAEMVRLDIDYVRNPSLWLDFKILVLTIPAVISGRGAG